MSDWTNPLDKTANTPKTSNTTKPNKVHNQARIVGQKGTKRMKVNTDWVLPGSFIAIQFAALRIGTYFPEFSTALIEGGFHYRQSGVCAISFSKIAIVSQEVQFVSRGTCDKQTISGP